MIRPVSGAIRDIDIINNLGYLIPPARDDEQHGLPTFFYQPKVAR